jgi:hypothetical protein
MLSTATYKFASCEDNEAGTMPDSAEALANTPTLVVEEIASETGVPSYSRRLSDKVLAAFNHAYAVGEIDVAARLREILAKLETERVLSHSQRHANPVALSHADLWVDFVEARNDYRVACNDDDLDAEAVEVILDKMKDAYQCWSSF